MKKIVLAIVCALPLSVMLLSGQSPRAAAPAKQTSTAKAQPAASPKATVDRYCVGCHNDKLKTANLTLENFDFAHIADHADKAELVIRKVRAGLMPPNGMPRPDAGVLDGMVGWMETELDRTMTAKLPPPGIHRLNRTEYTNAIRDVLNLEVDASKFLPSDDSTRGFDNIAGALTLSPALMEAYLSAAGKISRLAIGNINAATQAVFEVPADTAQNHHIEGLPFGTRGGILINYQFPVDGDYSFRVKGVTGYFQAVLGGVKGEQLEILIDGQKVHQFDWDRDISNTTGNGKATPKIHVKAGLHSLGVTFLQTNDLPGTEMDKPFARTMNTPGSIPGFLFYPHVGQVWIEGPYDGKGAADTATRKKIFVCKPANKAEEEPCAQKILSTLVKHAFRRPSNSTDMASLMEFFRQGRSEGGFDEGVEAGLQRILADPEFIYRLEPEPNTVAVGKTYRVNDLALASRLSFFLWSSVPDDELIDLAAAGKLKDPVVLEKQVKRMMADAKFEAFVRNFTGQWLSVRSLRTSEPVVNLFPDFDDNLRAAYQREVELFFASVAREDRSVLDLLDGNWTYVNERLAKQYSIPNIYGSQFRRVELPAELDARRGLLGKGALMTITSAAARTSPVTRGKWFLQTFLGVSPPDPPPNVPAIKEDTTDTTGNKKILTMRETMEIHHKNPTCATCHAIFEPMGIALENFDATGTWRTLDGDAPVDASGVLVDGTKVNGVADLRNYVKRRSGQFVRVITDRLMIYALGRGTEYQDMPTIRAIVKKTEPSKFQFSSLILEVVKSEPFQMNVKTATGKEQRASR